MFILFESHGPLTRAVVAKFETYEAAVAYALANYDVAYFEADGDVDYAAADFITTSGVIHSIEPVRS